MLRIVRLGKYNTNNKNFIYLLQFCSYHKKGFTPTILSNQMKSDSIKKLRDYRTRSSTSKEALQVIRLIIKYQALIVEIDV